MRVLIQSLNYAPELTGIGKYTGEFAEWLSSSGHQVRVVTAPPYYPAWKVGKGYSSFLYRFEVIKGVEVFRCPLYVPNKVTGLKRLLHLFSFATSSIPIMACCAFWRPDLIISIEPPLLCAPSALLTTYLSRSKSLLHIQDFEVDAAFELGIIPGKLKKNVYLVEKYLMSKFARVSTISNKMIEKVVNKGVSQNKIVYFPNWVDTEEIYPKDGLSIMRQELGIPDGALVALYSGNMGEKQGLEILVDAAKRLVNSEKIIFVMCGSGAAYPRLKRAAEGLGNIRWIPLQPLERLNDLLNLADIHLLPQRADAADLVMPSKLTGMMASGRPVLATAYEDTQVAITLKSAGKIVSPGDLDAFLCALSELVSDPHLRRQLGAEARRYAVQHWGKENVLSQFESDLLVLLS